MNGPTPRYHILRSIWLVATFRKDGVRQFQSTRDAYLASLAPIAALVLVAGIGLAARFGLLFSIRVVLLMASGILGPQVVSHFYASLIGRERLWLGYSVVFNWSQWAIPLFGMITLLAMGMLTAFGFPEATASSIARIGIAGYALALYVFITKHGLDISMLGSVLFIIAVNVTCSVLLIAPSLFEGTLD